MTVTIGTRSPRIKIISPTGMEIQLQHRLEKQFYEKARDKYLSEYEFPMENDLRSLDRLLMFEISMFRAQWQSTAGMDYDGVDLDAKEETELRRSIKDLAVQINDIQKELGVTKAQRESKTANSVGEYITDLTNRARLHGIKRNKEAGRAIELMKELFAMCGAYERSNELERRKLGIESGEDIVKYILEYAKPEFDAIDEAFRTQGPDAQRMWIRSM